VARSARILGVETDYPDGAAEIGRRSRGTPRIANRLLRRVRDFAQVKGDGRITVEVAQRALDLLKVDERGFDEQDRRLLWLMIDKFGGGPVGLDTLAAALGEERGTIEDVLEPYLIQQGFLMRTPRGGGDGPCLPPFRSDAPQPGSQRQRFVRRCALSQERYGFEDAGGVAGLGLTDVVGLALSALVEEAAGAVGGTALAASAEGEAGVVASAGCAASASVGEVSSSGGDKFSRAMSYSSTLSVPSLSPSAALKSRPSTLAASSALIRPSPSVSTSSKVSGAAAKAGSAASSKAGKRRVRIGECSVGSCRSTGSAFAGF